MVAYEAAPGLIFILDQQYECECGENEFRVLADKSNGAIYVCWCGKSYDEAKINEIMFAMIAAKEQHGQQGD